MIRGALISALILCMAIPARGERLWLVVGASDPTAAGIARKAKALAPKVPDALVVRTGDCGDKKSVFAWVPKVATSSEAARAALSRVRATIGNAYLKRCDTRPGTLLALRMSAVDPSIADVPPTAVNWEEKERISTTRTLPDGRAVVIVRSYVKTADDPLEGKRERVILAGPSGKRLVLEENCIDPGPMVTQQGRIAFHCVREQAGDHLMHAALVFDGSGIKLAEIPRCRNPKWSIGPVIECKEETVGPEGALTLRTKRTTLNPGGEIPDQRESGK